MVGNFIRQRREAMGLSQRALGLLFTPPVTTQFISNLERGVTPLPPNHVPTLTQALQVNEGELMALLEREYAIKLSGRLGKESVATPSLNGPAAGPASLTVSPADYTFMKGVYDAYRLADRKTRQAFTTVCESILNLPKSIPAGESSEEAEELEAVAEKQS
ncbi:MAG: helix-turn-helix domain-containing protein [Oligoflexia bacterium]|nr:helix-turn-helix domain-containing protein [Oligoflexia bacterium]